VLTAREPAAAVAGSLSGAGATAGLVTGSPIDVGMITHSLIDTGMVTGSPPAGLADARRFTDRCDIYVVDPLGVCAPPAYEAPAVAE
jgi:hypothetical protein